MQGTAGYVLAPNSAASSLPVKACAALDITKTNGVGTLAAGGTVSYTLTVSKAGPQAADGALLTDLPGAGLFCTAVSCTGFTGSAACPNPLGVTTGLLLGSGIVLTSLPAASSVSFAVTCGVTATGL